ncbi:NUDIX hydrolase [Acetonema longum]|uniref:ADP-ribose pyrophosphatase n=1 Tax=Acetonema longum DSM 6540 TaxID=1009370 RepID=F7NHB2_9FIRM|nr:NUDIX hydrolase [Acetonema longum]EGO64595.1 ADP-ribose pyrophosphatase [Acetonema longum DSM 6540]
MQQRFYFCPKCGGKLSCLPYDQRERLTCESCHFIMYENPIVGVAGILIQEDRILLGRRSQSSTYPGLWCIPCGYVEYEEEVREALKREFGEETGLRIEPQNVFAVLSNFHNPACHTVGIWFIVTQTGGSLTAGDDLDQAAFFSLDAIPPLAFPTDATVIDMLAKGRKIGEFSVAGK